MNWNNHRDQIIEKLKEGKEFFEIASELGVPEYGLKQYVSRNRLLQSRNKGRILAFEIVFILLRGNPDYFKPTRKFYKAVKIGQRRWGQIYRGEQKMTEDEYKRVTSHLGITLDEALDTRQLSWLDEFDNNNQ